MYLWANIPEFAHFFCPPMYPQTLQKLQQVLQMFQQVLQKFQQIL